MPAHAPEPSLVGLDVVGHFGWRDLPMQGLLILLPLDDSAESTLDLLAREGESWPQHFQPMDQMLLRQQGIGVQLGLQGLTWILQESLPASKWQQCVFQQLQLLHCGLRISPPRPLGHGSE